MVEYESHQTPPHDSGETTTDKRDRDFRMWAMCLHLSLLAGIFVAPIVGWIAPIVIWQIKKDEFPELDRHGRIVANWIISSVIYLFVSFLLIFVLIGIPLFVATIIVSIVFPIIGGVKANNGEAWPYPLSLRIF